MLTIEQARDLVGTKICCKQPIGDRPAGYEYTLESIGPKSFTIQWFEGNHVLTRNFALFQISSFMTDEEGVKFRRDQLVSEIPTEPARPSAGKKAEE